MLFVDANHQENSSNNEKSYCGNFYYMQGRAQVATRYVAYALSWVVGFIFQTDHHINYLKRTDRAQKISQQGAANPPF